MNNNFLHYVQTNVNGNLNDDRNCLNKYVSNNNCQGISMSNSQCDKQEKHEEQKGLVYENFKSFRKRIENKLDDVNFCSNPVYKTIVFIILVLILIYFIWFITRKQYSDDIDIRELVSTPFAK